VGFPAVFSVGVEDEGTFEEIRGVEVDTVMVSGRMVPAMAGDEALRCDRTEKVNMPSFKGLRE
jgi:hypothetical protein